MFAVILKKWGIIAFFIPLILFFTERALKRVHDEGAHLEMQLEALHNSRLKAEADQEMMRRQINSFSDPAWIELVLKKELGLIPEGQTKVFFNSTSGT